MAIKSTHLGKPSKKNKIKSVDFFPTSRTPPPPPPKVWKHILGGKNSSSISP